MIWLLDTNVLIDAQRGRPAAVRSHLQGIAAEDVAVATVTLAELWFGAARSPDPQRKQRLWRTFLSPFALLPFDRPAAELHGNLRHELRHQPIGERDLFIAATAFAHDLILVSANLREFRRVPGLRVEDWTA